VRGAWAGAYRRCVGQKLRDESPGYHHVVTRGNNKRVIYLDDRDRWFFCVTLERIAAKYGWIVIAYCLMENHYHIVLRVDERGLSKGMCELNTAYATHFNAEHGRINHLFGKRFWNRRLRTDRSLMNAVRYVVQNPRRAGKPGPLDGHRWTSYAATIGLAFSAIRFDRDELLELFGRTPEKAVEEFRLFCEVPVPPRRVRGQPP
jgi:REP element-mobilizing transposase RayT